MKIITDESSFSIHETASDMSFSTMGIFILLSVILIITVAKTTVKFTAENKTLIAKNKTLKDKKQDLLSQVEILKPQAEELQDIKKEFKKTQSQLKGMKGTVKNLKDALASTVDLEKKNEKLTKQVDALRRIKGAKGYSGFMVEFSVGARMTLKKGKGGYYDYDLAVKGPDGKIVREGGARSSNYLEHTRFGVTGSTSSEYVLQIPSHTGKDILPGKYTVMAYYRASGSNDLRFIAAINYRDNVRILYDKIVSLPNRIDKGYYSIFSFEVDSKGRLLNSEELIK